MTVDIILTIGLVLFLAICGLVFFMVAFGFKRPPYKLERGQNGEIYGYKVLGYDWRTDEYVSPRGDRWKGGELTADQNPSSGNESGVYSVKKLKDEAITFYQGNVNNPHRVKVEHSGVIEVHEYGIRSSKARIVKDYDKDEK